MGSDGYLLRTVQAPIDANPSAGEALSKALHVTMQHHKWPPPARLEGSGPLKKHKTNAPLWPLVAPSPCALRLQAGKRIRS